jgi:NAD(P)-dependent dehydrogenase (short-subunit alcohol dehydrogenase family)
MSDNHTRGDFILITGASTGIGRACATHLANKGYSVLAGVRKESDAAAIEGEATKSAGNAGSIRAIQLDVTSAASIASAAEKIRELTGPPGLRALVNNAGIVVPGPVEFLSIDDWRRQFEVNVFGQIAVTQAMLPLLRDHIASAGKGSARIILISSIAGLLTQPIVSAYSASKHALEAVGNGLRTELKPQGIHVCLIEPGAIRSEIWRKGGEAGMAIPADAPARKLYGHQIDAIMARSAKTADQAIPADHVARAVEKCLTQKSPRTRTLVGRDAKMAAILNAILPTRLFDSLMLKAMGIRQ